MEREPELALDEEPPVEAGLSGARLLEAVDRSNPLSCIPNVYISRYANKTIKHVMIEGGYPLNGQADEHFDL